MEEQIRTHLKALEASPANPEALAALDAIYTQAASWEPLAKVYEENAQRLADTARSPDLYLRAAEIYQGRLNRNDKAERCLRRALDLDGKNRSALAQLFPALKASGRFAEAADVLERLAESAVDNHERARRLEELGILLDEQLNQPDRALVAMQAAFSADHTLKSALLRGVTIYQRRGRHELAKGLLDVLLDVARDAEDAKLLANRYVEVAFKLLLSPARHDAARDAVARTLALVPDHPDAVDLRNRLEKYGAEWETHVRLLRDGAMEARDKTTAATRYLSIAEHYWIYGQNYERTEEFLDKAFTLVPGYWPAVRFLERICRESKKTDHLLQRLNKMALDITDVRIAVDLYLLIALLEAEAGADRDKLGRIYGKVTEIDPGNKSAATALTELHLDAGQFELAATVQARFAREVRDPRQRRAAHITAAQLYRDQLDNLTESLKHYEAARETDPNDTEAAEALEELYGKVGRHSDRARLIEKRIEHTSDPRARVALHDKLATCYASDLDDPLLAFEAMRKAYAIEPRGAREPELERLADSLARTGDLAQTYFAAAGRVDDVGERKRLLLRVATLANQASQAQLARDALSRILNEDPENEQALAALETLVAKGADARGLADTLEARLAVARATKERRMLLSRLAQLYMQELRESGKAIDRYRALLEIDPTDAEALEALDGLLRREERWRELSQIVEKRIGRAEGPVAAELKLRLAKLYEERLDKPREALALYEELHTATPDRLDLVAALERLLARGVEPFRVAGILQPHYAAVGAYRRQVDMIELRRQGTEDAKQRSSLSRESARILETELRNPREAFSALCAALLDDPADPTLPRDLDRLAEVATTHDELAGVLLKASAALPESPAKVALEARRAAILESRLGDAEAAIAAHRSLLRQNPGNLASLDALIGLLERTDQAEELVQWLEVRRQFASAEEQPAIDERLGRVLADQLGRPEAAVPALERARAATDVRVRERALVLLDQIYRDHNQTAPLLPVLIDRAALAVGTERAELFARIGELHLGGGEAEPALAGYRQAIELDGRNKRAADGLTALMNDAAVAPAIRREAALLIEPLRRSEQDLASLASVLKVRLATADQRAEKRALVAETALLMAQDLDDSDGALELLIQQLMADPEDSKSLQLAESVAIATGALDRLLAEMLKIVDAGGAGAESYGRRVAAIANERGLLPVARMAIEKLIALQPSNAALYAELVAGARQENNPLALGGALVALAKVAAPDQARAALEEATEVFVNADEYERGIEALRQHLVQFGFELAVADRLATLLAGLGRHGEIGGLWHEALGIAAPQQVAEIALRLGAVQLGPLENPQAAVKNFALCVERAIDEELTRRAVAMLDGVARGDSSARDAARVALAEHYRRTSNARPLIEVLEHTIEATADVADRAVLLDEVAILRVKLEEPTLAFAAASRAFRSAPSEQRLAQLRALAEQAGSEEAYVALLDEIAEESKEPAMAVALLHEAAQVAGGKLNDRAARVRLLQKVLTLAPGDPTAIQALEDVHREAAETGELVAILRRKAAATSDKEEKFAIRMQIAKLLLDDGDLQSAVGVLRDLYSDHQDRPEVLAALDVAFTRMGDHAGLAIVLDRRIHNEPDLTARGALATRLGRTHLATGQLREALDALWAAATDAPRDPALAAALGELLSRAKESGTPAPAEVADVLETVLRAIGSLEDLPPVLEIKLAAATDPVQRQKLLLEIAHIQETVLGQAPLAFMTACRALREAPGEVEALDRLNRIARRSRSEEELVDVLEETLDDVEDPIVQARLHARVAELQESTNQAAARILVHLEKAHQLTPDDQAVSESLVRIGRGKAVSAALASAMARVAAAAALAGETDKAHELWLEAAEMHEEQGDVETALADLQALVDFDGRYLPALRTLDRLYERLGRHFELVRVLEQEIELSETVQLRGELMLRLAEHKRVALLDAVGASAVIEKVALEIPGAVGLVGALERVAGDLAAVAGPEAGDARARIAGLLAPRYEASGDATKLVDILEARLAGMTDVGERRGVLLRVAKLRGSLGQPEQALAALSRALKESPGNDVLRNSVEQAAAESGEVESLVGLYEDIADGGVEPELALDYRRRIATLCRGPLGDPLRALGHYDQILRLLGAPEEDDEGRRMVRLQVVEAMAEISRAAEAWGPLAAALTRKAQLDPDAGRRRSSVLELSRLNLGPLGDVASAHAMARSLIASNPEDVEAIDLALQTSEQQGKFDELAELLAQRVELTEQAPQRLALRFRLGKLLDETLDRPDQAMEHFNGILEADPSHVETRTYLEERLSRPRSDRVASVDTLEAAYAKTGDWKKAISVIEAQVQDAERRGDMSTARQLLLRIGDIYTGRMGAPELAFVTLTRALKAERGEEHVRERLHDLAQQLESLDNLAELYESTAEAALGAGREDVNAELLEAAAAIYAFDLKNPDKGLVIYEAVLAKYQGRLSALAGLDKIYERTGQSQKLEQVLRKRLALCEDDSERVELYYRLGVCLADHLAQPAEAMAALERVLTIDPRHLEARRTLADLYVDANEDLKLRSVLESLLADAEVAGDLAEVQRLHTVLGRLLGARLMDDEAAVMHWEAVLRTEPANSEAPRALEDLYPKVGRYETLKELLEKQIATVADPARQAQLSSKLGLLLAEHLDDPDTAIAKFEKVLNTDPRNRDALDALRRIYGGMGRHEDLVGVLRRLLRLQTDAAGVKKVRFELAEVLGGPLNRRADAVEAGRRVLDVEPHTEEELQRLEAIFRSCEAWEECAQTLDRRVDLAAESGKRIPILYEIAALWEGPIGRREAAARAYERILAIEPGDPVAYRALCDLYVTANEWRKLVALKESRLPTIDSRPERLQLLREICEVYEVKLAQKDLAFLAACRAFREDVLDRECGQLMERLAIETDSIEELLDVYDDEVQRVGDELRAIEIHLRMAALCAQNLKDPKAAEGHLNRVFEYDAKNHAALDQLYNLFESQGRFEDAVAALERKADSAADLDSKKGVLFQICNLYEERLNRREDAVEGFRRVLELDGTDRRAISNLARLYEALGRWQALVGILQRAVDVEEDLGEQVNTRFRIAGIWETELNNAEQAIAVYRAILEIDPTHSASLKALERIYTQLDRMSELLGVYEKQVALATSIDEQVRLLAKIASIWEERFENVEQAVAATERVLLISPINEAAIKNLERLFKQTANWQRLIDVMRQHIELTREPQEIVTLYLEVGDIYYRELNRADKAEEMYLAAMDHDPRSRRGIHSLGQLYERSGNWFNALEKLAVEADLLGAEPEAVDIHYRMGKINEDMLLDTASARTSYERALDLDPGYLPAVKALKEIHYAAKEYEAYLKYLIREAEHVEDAEEKTELFTTAAKFLQERNGDLDMASQYYNEALRFTPDHMPAAVPLADIEFRRENWERARELIEIIVAKLDAAADIAEVVRQHYRLGYVNQKLDKQAESLRAFQRAFDLDSTYLPALEAYGQALVQAQRFEDARKVYTTLLMHHKDNLTDAEVVDYFWQLGEINRQLNQPDAALRNLEKALERDPSHAPSLRLLGEIQEGLEAFEEAYEAFSRLSGLLVGDERSQLLLHIGKLAQTKLNDPYRAIDAFEDANRAKRGDKAVLEAMYELYRETRQIPRATEVLEELLSIEPDEQTRVRLNFALGEVYRDELKNDLRSVQYFNAALDLDPTYVRAFEAIEKLLTARKQWQQLEENYRAMIQRTPRDSGKIRGVLWRNLAELYRRVLKQPLLASQAYTALCQIDPTNPEYMELLAELLAQIPQKVDEAMATYQNLVPISPEPTRAYHALRRLYLARQLHDRAFLACSALRALGKAEQEEQELYAHYVKYAPQKATRALTDRLWDALLVHDQAKSHLATVAALLYKHAATELLEDPRTFGLGKKGAWERPDSGKYFVNQLKYAHDVLATPPFELFERKRSDSVLTVLPVPAPSLGLGENNELFKEVPPRHMWFVAARMLTYTRPAFMLPFVLGPVDFQAAFEAALLFVEPRFQGKSDPEHIAAFARRLQRVREPLGEALKSVFKKILAERKRPDVNGFFEGIEYTAIRAAHMMSGDIDASAQLLRAKDPGHTQLQYRAKMKELLQFVVSEPYFELRTRLGLALKTQAS